MAHTPGPWNLKPSTSMLVFAHEGPTAIAAVADSDDAMLILAAPEMLAALKVARAFIEAVEERDRRHYAPEDPNSPYHIVVSAIANAEGKL